jgi:hypothetical protein
VVSGGVWAALIALSLPETLRNLVGDGTIDPGRLYHIPIKCMRSCLRTHQSQPLATGKTQSALRGFLGVFRQKDKLVVILAFGILYAVWNCLQASLSTLVIEKYQYTYLQAGLIYIPSGVGLAVAGFATGQCHGRMAFAIE